MKLAKLLAASLLVVAGAGAARTGRRVPTTEVADGHDACASEGATGRPHNERQGQRHLRSKMQLPGFGQCTR
jgi:hypothetical protein